MFDRLMAIINSMFGITSSSSVTVYGNSLRDGWVTSGCVNSECTGFMSRELYPVFFLPPVFLIGFSYLLAAEVGPPASFLILD